MSVLLTYVSFFHMDKHVGEERPDYVEDERQTEGNDYYLSKILVSYKLKLIKNKLHIYQK